MKLFAVILLSGSCAIVHAADLSPFITDGCSSFPDGTLQDETLWIDCCIRHDLAYWKGGTHEERLAADMALEHCVAKAGEPEIASLMVQGVRAAGGPLLPTPFRWGYGWPFPRDYKALDREERAQVRVRLASLQAAVDSALTELGTAE